MPLNVRLAQAQGMDVALHRVRRTMATSCGHKRAIR